MPHRMHAPSKVRVLMARIRQRDSLIKATRATSHALPALAIMVITLGYLAMTPNVLLAQQSPQASSIEIDPEPLPAIISLRDAQSGRHVSLSLLDLAGEPDEATWFSSRASGNLSTPDAEPLAWSWEQNASGNALEAELGLEVAQGGITEPLILELVIPELPGVEHDWLLFRDQEVTTGTFGRRTTADGQASSQENESQVITRADTIVVRTNTDGYLVLDQMVGIEGVLRFEDDRQRRPAFTARLLLKPADGKATIGFRIRQVPYLQIMRAKDRALASMHPGRARFASQGPPAVRDVRLSATSLDAYDPLTITAELSGQWINPFDPEDVTLDAIITLPDGRRLTVPGYLNQPHRAETVDGRQVITPAGEPRWEVRFTPSLPGLYEIRLVLDDGDGRASSEMHHVEVRPADSSGFIRVAKGNPKYFEFDDSSLYFPIGMNIGWSGEAGTRDYEMYLSRMAEHQANFVRIWLGPTFNRMGLERGIDPEIPGANGLGWIDLAAAWKIDEVFDIARRHDIRLMVAIESFSAMRDSGEPRHWHESPYNVALGGPLRRTGEMLSDHTARVLFRHRLRYIVARYGHHTTLLNWELWNEVNGIDGYDSEASASWHAEMADEIKHLDAYDHPISTSFWINHGDEAVDRLPQLDFTQTHVYGATDIPRYFIPIARRKLAKYDKPHLFGEYGVNVSAAGSTGVDMEGIHLHNGHWAALLSGSAGGPMVWWWDNYVHPNDLYHHFTPLARFVRGMPLHRIGFRAIEEVSLSSTLPTDPDAPRRPLIIHPEARSWNACDVNQPRTFTIAEDGRISDFDVLPAALQSDQGGNAHLHNPSTFRLSLPQPAQFIVHVEGISGWSGSRLQVSLNGELRIDEDFPDDNGASRQLIHTYDGPYTIDLPAGDHEIIVANKGEDWMNVSYEITDYLPAGQPNVDVWAARFDEPAKDGLVAVVWLRDSKLTWRKQQNDSPELDRWDHLRLTIPDLASGDYTIEWWDTMKGTVTGSTAVTVSGRNLSLDVPEFHQSLAAKIRLKNYARQEN